jgi:3D (Asp-Asp-Asp) domain-containing protein
MHHHPNNNVVITAATLATLVTLIVVIVSSGAITPVAASTAGNNNTTTTTSSGLELSPQPVWKEVATNTGITPINQTHSIATFIGNGTLTIPDTGETINMTNNGTAFISPLTESGETVSAYGKENVFSQDGDTSAITFYEIVRYNPTTFQGKGITIAVFDTNATGSLAPFNGMMIVGTHDEDPNIQGTTFTLWEWESGIPLPPTITTTMEEPRLMNTTTMTNATTAETNATSTTEEGEEEQQPATMPAPLLE